MDTRANNWDQHWYEFRAQAELGPTTEIFVWMHFQAVILRVKLKCVQNWKEARRTKMLIGIDRRSKRSDFKTRFGARGLSRSHL
jgi:hypothetical protein